MTTIGRKTVLRSPWAAVFVSACGFVALALGLTYLVEPDAGGAVVRLSFGVPLTALGVWATLRPWCVRVVISSTGDRVVLHGMVRNERMPREAIVAVEVAVVAGALGEGYTVGFRTLDGNARSVASMATYGFGRDPLKGRVGRQLLVARQALGLPASTDRVPGP